MTPFLSTMTQRGVERARRVREATTAEEMAAVRFQMANDLASELAGGSAFSRADEYVFLFALGGKTAAMPRAAAALYDGAANVALSARAFHEALLALEKAEEARPLPQRMKQVKALRQALFPAPTRGAKGDGGTSPRPKTKRV